jgi:hypothetical protein
MPVALASPVQKRFLAGDSPIAAAAFRFRIVRVAFDTTTMGFVPESLGPKERIFFVEFELLSGDREDFKNLLIILSDGSGRRAEPVALALGGAMKTLVPMTSRSGASHYRPDATSIAWAYVIQEGEREFFLTFPTGEIIDLAPLIRDMAAKVQGMALRSAEKRSYSFRSMIARR